MIAEKNRLYSTKLTTVMNRPALEMTQSPRDPARRVWHLYFPSSPISRNNSTFPSIGVKIGQRKESGAGSFFVPLNWNYRIGFGSGEQQGLESSSQELCVNTLFLESLWLLSFSLPALYLPRPHHVAKTRWRHAFACSVFITLLAMHSCCRYWISLWTSPCLPPCTGTIRGTFPNTNWLTWC